MRLKMLVSAAALVAIAGCATQTWFPEQHLDESLVGKKIEIMTGEEKRIVKVERIEKGVIYTESGETFVNADIVNLDPSETP